MEHGLLAKSPRIEVVDALRGFAVMAIMLLHNIEHFNFYDFPTASSAFMEAMDKGIWETLFFLFSGKAYAIFSLLFGFSFFIQYNNQAKKGKDFRLRFLWRLFLLFIIGCFNGAFFPGDILVLYSIIWRGARVSLQMERPGGPHCCYYPDAPAARTRQVFLCDDES